MRIEIKNLCKQFDDGREVLNHITLSDEVQSLAVIGPSGGGKSTLLRILAGLIYPTSGEVLIDGEAVSYTEKSLITYRRSIGFVFQSKGLFSHLTAVENIVLPLVKVQLLTKHEANQRANDMLSRFGLADHKEKYPYELSGGQQQRIAIARAMAAQPRLLLLDEPTSALDPEYTHDVLNMLNVLKKENTHMIIVTHEMGFAKNACETAAFLSRGSIVEYGRSSRLFTNPQSEALGDFLNKVLEWKV